MKQGERPGTARCTCRRGKVSPYKGWIGLTTVILSKGSVCSCAVCVYRPDAEQVLLPAGGMLARHQAQLGGKLPPVLERARSPDRCHEGGVVATVSSFSWSEASCCSSRAHSSTSFQNSSWLRGVSLSLSDSSSPTTACRNFATLVGITMTYACRSP